MSKLKQRGILRLIMVENRQLQHTTELAIPIKWGKVSFEKISYYDAGAVWFEYRDIYSYFICSIRSCS